MRKACLIVPCYNEFERLDATAFRELATHPDLTLLFVDDGSTDATRRWLRDFCAGHDDRAQWTSLPRNAGKAEAVRQGLRLALAADAEVVAYTDADLAAPVAEVHRLLDLSFSEDLHLVLGSRIRFLGTQIERSPLRHYLGRIFATFASLVLGVPVYDTQCGLKAFRRTAALEAALAEPFRSRWCFDVELLARLLIGAPGAAPVDPARIREMPLGEWRDVRGSKLRVRSAPRIALELVGVVRDVRRRRRAIARPRA